MSDEPIEIQLGRLQNNVHVDLTNKRRARAKNKQMKKEEKLSLLRELRVSEKFDRELILLDEWLHESYSEEEKLFIKNMRELDSRIDWRREEATIAAFYAGYHSRDEEIKQIHKDYGYEARDPNGTIWDHCQKLQERNDRIELILKDVSKFLKRLPDEWFPETLNNIVDEAVKDK